MPEHVIECFTQEYDRFHGLLEQQIDACPGEDVWLEKIGGIAYWHHIMHSLGCIEHCARSFGTPYTFTRYPRDVVRFRAGPPHEAMSRDEMRALAADMKKMVHEYFKTLTAESLTRKNETLSQHMGQDATHQTAILFLIRHPAYHIGCLDTVLRSHGVPGVY